jgi:hypothetical protein
MPSAQHGNSYATLLKQLNHNEEATRDKHFSFAALRTQAASVSRNAPHLRFSAHTE